MDMPKVSGERLWSLIVTGANPRRAKQKGQADE